MNAKMLVIGFAVALTATAALSDPPPLEINITTDSAPGWLPSVELSAQAEATLHDYIAATDANRVSDAYAMLSDIQKQNVPFETFKTNIETFNARAGAVIERRIVKVTWTKDPANAPAPGVYVAIDIVSRFANIDRHCGYIALYLKPDGGAFQIQREEFALMDNATAQTIAKEQGEDGVEKMWAKLSAYCPNYPREP